MTNTDEHHILTIQSHVVHGYVGNKISTFVLQISGLYTDSVNSVQFSNHTHYKYFKGQILSSNELEELLNGLVLNNLDSKYSHILTGYSKSLCFSTKLYEFIKQLKSEQKSIFYLCDPVLGDNGKLYVPNELVDFYRDQLLPIADAITPNQFEAETLSDIQIKDELDVLKCIEILHSKGPKIVVISGVQFANNKEKLTCFASTNKGKKFKITIPKFDVYFVGTGDLFTSLFLVWLIKTNYDVKQTLENVVFTVENILIDTIKYAESKKGGLDNINNVELRLISGKKYIDKSAIKYECEQINI